jgi:hypothetical protein
MIRPKSNLAPIKDFTTETQNKDQGELTSRRASGADNLQIGAFWTEKA